MKRIIFLTALALIPVAHAEPGTTPAISGVPPHPVAVATAPATAPAAANAAAAAVEQAALLKTAKEIQVQQVTMAENQAKIDERLTALAEALRVARIYSSRSGN